jgi:hypothetical protein
MPAAGLASDELTYTFTVDPDALKPCVFTNVETLIH